MPYQKPDRAPRTRLTTGNGAKLSAACGFVDGKPGGNPSFPTSAAVDASVGFLILALFSWRTDFQASKYLIVVSSRAGSSFQSPEISHETCAIFRLFAAHQAWIALWASPNRS